MEYRNLGKTGLKVSALSLGTWLTVGDQIDRKTAAEIFRVAIDHGVNFFDMADSYSKGETERVAGELLSGYSRADLVLSSKVFWPMSEDVNDRGLSRKHIFVSIDQTLRRLHTDYLDVYFVIDPIRTRHWKKRWER